MEIRGKIIVKLPLQSGTSKAGNPWSKQEYVLETMEAYPKRVHFDFFGERANQYPLEVGDLIDLSFDIESREYNGRWYTSIRGWKADKVDPNALAAANDPNMAVPASQAPTGPAPTGPAPVASPAVAPQPDFGQQGEGDDLPF
jgi:hypothetical protein